MHHRSLFTIAAVVALLSACGTDPAAPISPEADPSEFLGFDAGTIRVVNSNDDGPGSLRSALERLATQPGARKIQFAFGLNTIYLQSSLVYDGDRDLVIDGRNGSIHGPDCDKCDGLVVTSDVDVSLEQLTFKNAAGNGVSVRVPATASGNVEVQLRNVTIKNNGLHGLLVDDQVTPPPAEFPNDDPVPFGFDSPASIVLDIQSSLVIGNGFGGPNDFDGVRIDEGGIGGITANVRHSQILENGADGLELDERGPGNAKLEATLSHFDRNGPNNADDPDDAIDIDEADDGSIFVRLTAVTGNGNFDEGFDFTEAGAGDIDIDAKVLEANGNADEGFKAEETGDGDLKVRLVSATVNNTTGADGVQFSEAGNGDLVVNFLLVSVRNNLEKGIHLDETGAGTITAKMTLCAIVGNGFTPDPDDFEVGIAADEDDAGPDGTLELVFVQLLNNAGGNLDLDNMLLTQVPSP